MTFRKVASSWSSASRADDDATCAYTSIVTAICATLVRERLVACAQLAQVQSTYWWDGQVQSEPETRATMHTTAALVDTIAARVVELHPYDVPAVLSAPLSQVNAPYAAWVEAELRPSRP